MAIAVSGCRQFESTSAHTALIAIGVVPADSERIPVFSVELPLTVRNQVTFASSGSSRRSCSFRAIMSTWLGDLPAAHW